MIHPSLPQSKTPEQLAQWITEHKADSLNHTEKFPLTKEEIHTYQEQSSNASRAIDRLTKVSDVFKNYINKGTPSIEEPIDVTIPPTKGLKALKSNREFADAILEAGYRKEVTIVYFIPNPEEQKMVAVDIEGKEWPQYTRDFTPVEHDKFKPMLEKKSKSDKTTKTEEDYLAELG